MNRLIILGNGFDLAHGLKTKYEDFLKYELIEAIWGKKSLFSVPTILYKRSLIDYIDDENDSLEDIGLKIREIDGSGFDCNNSLVNNSLKAERWIDFESMYYEMLKECIIDSTQISKEEVMKVNENISQVRDHFEKYLLQLKYKPQRIEAMSSIMTDSFKEYDFSYYTDDVKLGRLCFLNFNYTNTINLYTDDFRSHEVINIHGQINDDSNSIIFGYGDELDDQFQLIERLNDNGLLQNFKSPKYLLTDNYFKLSKFLSHNEYQVYIIGHSCGLTDRTLLNHVFEHENCRSIKIFYHKSNAVDIIYEISRHFNDKAKLRSRVVGLSVSEVCPQLEEHV